VVAVLGLARVDITGRVLGVLLCAELAVIVAQTVGGLARPAGGHLSFAALSPAALGSAGFATFGVLAVVAVLGFVGFEQAPVLAEEAKNPRRTVPAATYAALGMIAVVYAGASWGGGERPAQQQPAVPGRSVAVFDVPVRRRASIPQRYVALHLRPRPRERAPGRVRPDQRQ
jgi:hypothetical protein